MAEIATFPLVRHLRAEPTAHVLHYRRGALARDGAGLAFWIDELVRLDLVTILTGGVAPIRDRIAGGLAGEPALGELGLEVVAVRVAAVTPTAEVEKALRQPTREAIQQRADEATFGRRGAGGREGAGDRRERAPEPHRARPPRGAARRAGRRQPGGRGAGHRRARAARGQARG